MMVHAPSLSLEELAAVMVPALSKAGLRVANFSGTNFWHSSSLVYFFSLPLMFSTTSVISQSKSPLDCASLARS
jgi:hypothetical protein